MKPNQKQKDFLIRLKLFFNSDFEKGELNEREQIKEQLSEELLEL